MLARIGPELGPLLQALSSTQPSASSAPLVHHFLLLPTCVGAGSTSLPFADVSSLPFARIVSAHMSVCIEQSCIRDLRLNLNPKP